MVLGLALSGRVVFASYAAMFGVPSHAGLDLKYSFSCSLLDAMITHHPAWHSLKHATC